MERVGQGRNQHGGGGPLDQVLGGEAGDQHRGADQGITMLSCAMELFPDQLPQDLKDVVQEAHPEKGEKVLDAAALSRLQEKVHALGSEDTPPWSLVKEVKVQSIDSSDKDSLHHQHHTMEELYALNAEEDDLVEVVLSTVDACCGSPRTLAVVLLLLTNLVS